MSTRVFTALSRARGFAPTSARRRRLHAHAGGGSDRLERIASGDNDAVKRFAKLCKSKSFRDAERSVVLASSVLMRECFVSRGGARARTLFVADWAEKPDWIDADRVVRAPASVMKKCAGVNNGDGLDLIGEFEMPEMMDGKSFAKRFAGRRTTRTLALEGVQDPGNLGTLARTAVAFGWDTVALLPGTCDPFNDKAMRAARGATFRLNFVTFDSFDELERAARELGMDLYAAEPRADEDVDPERVGNVAKACLVLGTEGQGLSDDALRACKPVAVPMSGEMESLNVAIAGGILCYLMRLR
jgi:RNA methyltransferase, TrmH family